MAKKPKNVEVIDPATEQDAGSFISRASIEEQLKNVDGQIEKIIELRRQTSDHLRKLEATQFFLQGEREALKRLLGDQPPVDRPDDKGD